MPIGSLSLSCSGICEKSSSTLARPMSASIALRSSGEFGIYLICGLLRRLRFYVVLVLDCSQKSIDLGRILDLDANHPTISVRVAVHVLGRIVQSFVDLDDSARERHVDLAHSFHALDRAEWFGGFEPIRHLWKLNVDHITELMLSVIGDSYRCFGSLDSDP